IGSPAAAESRASVRARIRARPAREAARWACSAARSSWAVESDSGAESESGTDGRGGVAAGTVGSFGRATLPAGVKRGHWFSHGPPVPVLGVSVDIGVTTRQGGRSGRSACPGEVSVKRLIAVLATVVLCLSV